ncbi:SRPBCC family protein [Kordiimonas pumila]|uniref:SRPBCC family protein n=1 Tax=Kordiimonas pumila TaxID=2161677 RepID=A0ABV7D7Q0_9PROT|nr:SRPBCC family protein [Kordiimonas pumila]
MFALSYTIPINPAGAQPVLTRDQVWRGLEMKATDAKPFVKGMTQCDVLERKDNTLLREITFAGDTFREFITFHAPVQVHFTRVDSKGASEGFIENTISESEAGLMLTFTFALTFPGTKPGSEEERAKGEGMRGAYVGAVAATLNRVRELVQDGTIV